MEKEWAIQEIAFHMEKNAIIYPHFIPSSLKKKNSRLTKGQTNKNKTLSH